MRSVFVCWCTIVALMLTLHAAAKDDGISCLFREHCTLLATVCYGIQWESGHALVHAEAAEEHGRPTGQLVHAGNIQSILRPWEQDGACPAQIWWRESIYLTGFFPFLDRCCSRVWWKAQLKTRSPFASFPPSFLLILAKNPTCLVRWEQSFTNLKRG